VTLGIVPAPLGTALLGLAREALHHRTKESRIFAWITRRSVTVTDVFADLKVRAVPDRYVGVRITGHQRSETTHNLSQGSAPC